MVSHNTLPAVGVLTGSLSGNDPNPVDIPALADFAWINQGVAAVEDNAFGIVLANDEDSEHHILQRDPPGASYDIYARLDLLMLEASASGSLYNQGCIVLRNATTQAFVALQVEQGRLTADLQYRFQITRWTNATTISASVSTFYAHRYFPWIRANVSPTTITFYVLFGGKWIQIGTETIATFVGVVDKVGFSFRSDTGMDAAHLHVANFGFNDPLAA